MTISPRTPGPHLLLMGGGIDSSALAQLIRPAAGLVVDYGQAPAEGEVRAATAVGAQLGLDVHTVRVDLSSVGAGLLSSGAAGLPNHPDYTPTPELPSPEWWPYRNQLLVSVAAAWAFGRSYREIITGTVAGDGQRHADGLPTFYDALDALMSMQEGGFRVSAPAIGLTATELITESGVDDSVLGWTHSCHVAAYACGRCPGCFKAAQLRGDLDSRP